MKLLLFVLFLLTVPQTHANEEAPSTPSLSIPPSLPSTPSPLPFAPGEHLVYEVRYLGLNAGTATLSVLDAITLDGREIYPLRSTAQSSDLTSIFYPVNDYIESYLDVEGMYSHSIRIKQREGKRRRDKTIAFDQVAHKALQIKDGEQEVFDVPEKVHDSLSSLYYFRLDRNLTPGRSVFIDVHESEKNWRLEIQVLGYETVTTPLGTFNTIKVKTLPRYEGIFINKGAVVIWVTNDDRRIPVIMESKVKIGSITVTLISRRDGQKTPAVK